MTAKHKFLLEKHQDLIEHVKTDSNNDGLLI